MALVYKVDQNLARTLREQGIVTIEQLLNSYDEETLSEVTRPWGKGTRMVGKDASTIIRQAQAMAADDVVPIADLRLGVHDNYVMFDVEGMPPHLDEIDKVYMWGVKVFGKKPSPYMCGLTGFGEEGDREGWHQFLRLCQSIFDEYGDIPFIHWSHYEATKIRTYVERYGDLDDIAGRTRENLLDLHVRTRGGLVIPEPSYSLKVIEERAGFVRSHDEYSAHWAMAQYIEATEAENPELRTQMIEEIKKYNEEDLNATWEVFQWVRSCVR